MAGGRIKTQIFGSADYPVKTDNGGRIFVSAAPDAGTRSEAGRLYSVCTGEISVAQNDYLALLITNPANSGKVIYIERLYGLMFDSGTLALWRNPALSISGTPLTPRNLNWSFPDNSAARAEYAMTSAALLTGGIYLTSYYTNTWGGTGDINIDFHGEIIIPGGATDRTFGLQVSNPSWDPMNFLVNIVWYELDA